MKISVCSIIVLTLSKQLQVLTDHLNKPSPREHGRKNELESVSPSLNRSCLQG